MEEELEDEGVGMEKKAISDFIDNTS